MADKILSPADFYKKVSKEDRDAIVDLSIPDKFEFIPTGSWVLNTLIGDGTNKQKAGGFPRGHIVEIFGDESCGKTTIALSACKQTQDLGGLPVFVDFERTFHKGYARALGIDLDPNKFVLMQPDHFQHGARMIKDALMMKPWLIVVDSVSAMIPKEFLEGKIDESGRIGLQAQLMSAYLSNISKRLAPSNTCLLFTNQMRSVIKDKYDPGPKEESSGGRALKFYSSVRIKLRKSTIEKVQARSNITGKSEKKAVNLTVKVTIAKNKIDTPYYTAPVYIRFGEGFDNMMSIIELAINDKVIKKAGAFLSFKDGDEEIFKVRGKENLRNKLMQDSEAYDRLKNHLVFKQDQRAKEEYEEEDNQDEMDEMLQDVSANFMKKEEKGEETEEDD